MDRFRGNGHKLCIFLFSKARKFKTRMAQVPYNKLLLQLARAILGNIGPQSFLYGPRSARSVLPQPQANIAQYGPSARLVVRSLQSIYTDRTRMVHFGDP